MPARAAVSDSTLPAADALATERAHLDSSRAALRRMREETEALDLRDVGATAVANETAQHLIAKRIAALADHAGSPLFFGRVDGRFADGVEGVEPVEVTGDPNKAVEAFWIGRRHVHDEHGDPMVVDWRAPLSRAFYRANRAEPLGVELRRRFGWTGGELTAFEDEHLTDPEEADSASGILAAEIERPRVGPMRDIVATIQPEQDEIVRSDLTHTLCVQGAPGTGKTAVGLHRAAYLLYSYPERLRRSGVLVVGPNSAFLRYIAAVLPALGENGIQQSTVDQLVSSVPPGREDPVPVAVLKGDARMAELLRRAVFSYVVKPTEDVVPIVGTRRYRIPVERVRRHVDDARRSMAAGELHWNSARERLRQLLAQDVRRQREDAGGAPSDADTAKVARSAQVREFLDAVWPVLDPRVVLLRLFSDEEFARRCAGGKLSADELQLLRRTPPFRPVPASKAAFSAADLVLLDELVGLITGVEGFVHVVVD
jgi:hypothetical protein